MTMYTQYLLLPLVMTGLGLLVRFFFWRASMKAMAASRRPHETLEDFGLSFDERVARRLAELDGGPTGVEPAIAPGPSFEARPAYQPQPAQPQPAARGFGRRV